MAFEALGRDPTPLRRAGTWALVLAIAASGALAGRVLGGKTGAPTPPSDAEIAPSTALFGGVLAQSVKAAEPGSFYWGAYRPDAPYKPNSERTLEQSVARRPSILMWYQEWSGRPAFPTADATALARRGIVPMISWEAWAPPVKFGDLVVEQPAYKLLRIARGSEDVYLKRYAKQVRTYGGPVMLRLFHEMDGTWYPWGGTVNGNNAVAFRAAWKHIHRIFDAAGATNVTWVWSVNHVSVPDVPGNRPADFWPGTEYVDWIGISGFNWGRASRASVWKGISRVLGTRYEQLLKYHKPIALTETAAPELGGNKAAWIRATFRTLAQKYPMLSALVWYDKKDSNSRDWRIESSAVSLRAFRDALTARAVLSAPAAFETTRPSASDPTLLDRFDRSLSDSWGPAWKQSTTAGDPMRLSVDGARAVASAGAGVDKGLIVTGVESDASLEVSAAISSSHLAAMPLADHWQVLVRMAGRQSFYAFQISPNAALPAQLELIRARNGHFTSLTTGNAGFVVRPKSAYRIRARVVTDGDIVKLWMRAWPASSPEPGTWMLRYADTSLERVLVGRAGIRLSITSGPLQISVDDFAVKRVR